MPDDVEAADAAIDEIVEDAVPEGPAPEEESSSEEEAQPEDGQPRDKQGRFAEASTEEAESEAEVAPEGTESQAEESVESTESPDKPTEEAEPAPLEVFPEFSYHADGTEHKVPGSAVGKNGAVYIPPDRVRETQLLLASGKAYGRQHQEDVQRTEAAVTRAEVAEEQSRTVLEKMEELASNPQAAEEWLLDLGRNWPVLKAQSETNAIRKQGDYDRGRLETIEQRERDAAELPRLQTRLGQLVEGYGKQAGLNPESPEDFKVLQAVYQRWVDQDNLNRLFPRADRDDASTGIRKGERYESRALIEREFQFVRSLRPLSLIHI